ncbi:hypothetical protein [Rhodoferax ferrireducens]|uniref:hypothetical protein n=1 Tax=Rhodoferax ferrireducens TaxID=192843 RepID=UPI001E3D295A|nr:hypothetical protein [Rhodoferax ferrireducens]
MQTNITVAKAALVMALCSSSGWSLASEVVPSDDMPPAAQIATEVAVMQVEITVPAEPPVVPAVPVEVSGFGMPLVSGQLEDYRGGFDLVKNDMQLSGSVADNSARNFTTGSNYIADGSFANSSGLPIVIQNSGANVLIQNATIFNLQLQ